MAKEVRYKIQKQGEKSSNPDQEYEWLEYNGDLPGFHSGNKDPDRTGSKPFRLNVVQDRILN